MRPIRVDFIAHGEQRYDTVGDYQVIDGFTCFKISACADMRSCLAVFVHELIEQYLTERNCISEQLIDEWDITHVNVPGEPGEIEGCPYFEQHAVATKLERVVCEALGLTWEQHESSLENAVNFVNITPPSSTSTGYD